MQNIFNFFKRMDKVIIYGYPLLVVLSIIFINTFDIIGLIIVACFLPFFVMAVRRNNFESENTRLFFAILNKLFIKFKCVGQVQSQARKTVFI